MSKTFTVNENRLFAPIHIGQIDGYGYLDTGARYSSILQSYSEHSPKIGVRDVRGALAATSVDQVHIDEIAFLGETFHDIVVDVQPDSQGGLDTLPFRVIMALGCDVLLQKALYLNFDQSEIDYLESDRATKGLVSSEADFGLGLPIFKVSIGNHTFDALFDTGGGLSVLNQILLTKLEKEMTEDEPIEVEDATGVKHQIPTFRSKGLAIGDHLLGECRFLVLDLSVFEQESGRRIDCVFGINAMMNRSWIVDSLRQRIEMM